MAPQRDCPRACGAKYMLRHYTLSARAFLLRAVAQGVVRAHTTPRDKPDFGFSISDFGLKRQKDSFFNPKSKIRNPKSSRPTELQPSR